MKMFGLLIGLIMFVNLKAQDSLITFGNSTCYFEWHKGFTIRMLRPCEWVERQQKRLGMEKEFFYRLNAEKFYIQFLKVKKIPRRYTAQLNDSLFGENLLRQMVPQSGTYVSSTAIQIDTFKGTEFIFRTKSKAPEKSLFQYEVNYFFVYQQHFVLTTFIISASKEEEADDMFRQYQVLFREIGTSVKLMSN